MQALPWVISVDDHVVEPPHVWQRWLPEQLRERGPRVVQDTLRDRSFAPAATIATYVKGGAGPVVDWWVYEDLQKPIPQVMACAGFPPESLHPRADPLRRRCAPAATIPRPASPTWT